MMPKPGPQHNSNTLWEFAQLKTMYKHNIPIPSVNVTAWSSDKQISSDLIMYLQQKQKKNSQNMDGFRQYILDH